MPSASPWKIMACSFPVLDYGIKVMHFYIYVHKWDGPIISFPLLVSFGIKIILAYSCMVSFPFFYFALEIFV